MKSSGVSFTFIAAMFISAAAHANRIDMNDPRRALAREDDVRVDAQLLQDSVSSNCKLTVTYRIQNFSKSAIAVADQISDVSFDRDSGIITIALGSEVPVDGLMPRMIVIPAGEKKTFSRGAPVHILVPSMRSPFTAIPRAVQMKVNVLRDLAPFASLLAEQSERNSAPKPLDDAQFESWLEGNDMILLNQIPVRWNPSRAPEDLKMGKLGTF